MFDKLKKLLEGGVAQVNPWDNGKTFQSVVNNRTPQQQNAVQQQQQQARVFNPARPQQAPQQNFTDKLRDILDANSQADKYRRAQMGQATSYQEQQAKAPNVYNQVAGAAEKFSRYHPLLNPMAGLNLANDASNAKIPGLGVSASQVAQQVPQAVQSLPKELPRIAKNVSDAQNSLAPMHIRDILDANTAEDIRKRTQAGEAAMYADQQKALGNKRPNQNIGAALLGGTARFANTAKAGYDEATDTGMLLLANQMYGDRGRDEMLRRINERQQSQYQPDSGIFGSGTWFNSPEDFQKTSGDPLALIPRAAASVGETALEKASFGAGQVRNKLAEQGLEEFIKLGFKKAGVRGLEGAISDALGQTFTRDEFSPEQTATSAAGAVALPIGVSGAGKVLRKGFNLAGGGKVIGALGRQFRKPRSVAEIAQEVATARQPVIANNAPRVTPDGTILPPRPASEIAAELAASKARAIDPNVQARRTAMNTPGDGLAHVTTPGSALGILDDGKIRANPIGEQGGAKGVSMGTNYKGRNGETLNWADQFAEPGQPKVKINIDRTKLNAKQLLQNDMELTHTGDVPLSAIKSIETDSPKVAAEYRAKGIPVIDTNAKQPRAVPQNVPKSYTQREIPASNQRTIDSYSTPKPVTEYKVGERVSNATSQGGTVDGTIVKTPDFSKDLRYKGNHFEVKLSDGTIIKTDGAGFDNPTTPSKSYTKPKPLVPKDSLAPNGRVKTAEVDNVFNSLPDGTVGEYGFVKKNGKIYPPNDANITPEVLKKSFIDLNPDGSVKEGFGMTKMSFLDGVKDPTASPKPKVTAKPTAIEQNTGIKTPTAFEQNTGVVAPTRAKATTPPGGGMPPAKAGASPAAPVPPRKPGKKGKTSTALNTNRMDLTPEQRAQLDPKVQAVVDTMSNEDVARVAKGAGLDTNTYSPGETRVKIAEQLNARQDVVRIMNEAEVARKAGNTERAAELLKQAAEQGRAVRSQGTDLGRQLQARKIIANELDTPQQRVFKLLDEAGVNPDVYAKRFAGVDFTDFKQVVDAYRELVPAKAGQWLDTVRYNSMLSSPLTQIVNIFGNAQGVLGVAPIEKTIKGGIDSIAGLFGKERQYAAGEGAAYLKGEAKAVGKAAKAFMNALRGVDDYANQDFTDYNIPLATQGAGGKVYNALSFPMRVLDGMDKFFRTLAAAGEDAALTKRTSKGIALRGDRQSLLEQEAAYRVFQADSHIPGQGAALNAMDSIADLVMSGRNNSNPIVRTLAKFTIPFVKTINNINKQGNFEYSPLGFLNLIGKEDKVEGITRAVMGTAVFGTSALMLKGGDMTWAEPRNAEERARFRAEGKQPYSVKIGGKWVGFSKLHPAVSFPMAMTAALDDAFNKGEIDQSFIDKTLTGFAKYGNFMSDQSYAKSVGDTLGAIGGDKEAIARAVSNQWQQLIPARALTGWIARMSDDVERKVDTTAGYFDQQVQSFMQQYPGLRQSTPTRDYKGEPIAANNPVLNAFSPVRVTDDRGVNPLDAEQDAIKAATEQPELLNKRQLKEIDDRTADKVREAQKQLISQPGWSDLTPEEKKSGLSRLESDIKAVEKLQYQAEKQVGQYSGSFTGKGTKLTANQKALINDGVKIGKYVGKSDSTEAKTNKEKYEQALEKFNDPDNGYSKVEKIKKTEELKRLTVQKDYDEDTTMLHGMSKEDVWGFLSTYEDGKAMADKLLALDDALTAAGVQDKNKFRDKYGNIAIKPKEKSSGKGGSKAKTVKGQAEAVSSERKLRALLANTNNKTSYRKPATQSAKVGLKKFAVKSAGITSRKGA